jgi:NMD protein affecting ribosome stability and mRNA decay
MSACPNCGRKPYKTGDSCEKCGYLESKATKLAEATLVFCRACGCHYLDECRTHTKADWDEVKL